jgi:hypothetical protein
MSLSASSVMSVSWMLLCVCIIACFWDNLMPAFVVLRSVLARKIIGISNRLAGQYLELSVRFSDGRRNHLNGLVKYFTRCLSCKLQP